MGNYLLEKLWSLLAAIQLLIGTQLYGGGVYSMSFCGGESLSLSPAPVTGGTGSFFFGLSSILR